MRNIFGTAMLGWFAVALNAAELAKHELLLTSVRTGDTEVFVVNAVTGDARHLSFMSDRENTTNLWVCNADGSHVRRLNRTPDVSTCRVGRKSSNYVLFGEASAESLRTKRQTPHERTGRKQKREEFDNRREEGGPENLVCAAPDANLMQKDPGLLMMI